MSNENKSMQLNAKEGGAYFSFTLALYVIISFLGQAVMGAITEKTSALYIGVCGTFSAISFALAIFFAVKIKKIKFTEITGKTFGLKFLPVAVVMSVGMFFGFGYVNEAVSIMFKNWGLNVNNNPPVIDTVGKFILYTFVLALLPAVFEELFFRGIILNSLKKTGLIASVMISSLSFALYHGSVTQLVYQFIYGVGLGFLFVSSKSVLPGMVAHFINNFFIVCSYFFGFTIDLWAIYIILIGALMLAIFCTVIFFVLRNHRQKTEKIKGELVKFIFPLATFGYAICIALAVGSLVA